MSPDKQETSASLLAVIFQYPFGQRRTIICASAQEVVQVYRHQIVSQAIARIHTPHVRADRTLQSAPIIPITEDVVPVSVRSQTGVVMFGSEHKRCPAAPSADHLRGDQLFFFRRRGLLAEVFAELGHSCVKFAKSKECAVTPQDFRLGKGDTGRAATMSISKQCSL